MDSEPEKKIVPDYRTSRPRDLTLGVEQRHSADNERYERDQDTKAGEDDFGFAPFPPRSLGHKWARAEPIGHVENGMARAGVGRKGF